MYVVVFAPFSTVELRNPLRVERRTSCENISGCTYNNEMRCNYTTSVSKGVKKRTYKVLSSVHDVEFIEILK